MKLRFWLTFGAVSLVFVITLAFGVNTFASYQSSLSPTPIPTSTRTTPAPEITVTPSSPRAPVTVEIRGVDNYYAFLIKQDYPNAYTSFDPAGTIVQQPVSVDEIKQLDGQKGGPVTLYTFESVTFSGTTSSVTLDIQRGSQPPYQVHLQLKKEGPNWKIIAADNI